MCDGFGTPVTTPAKATTPGLFPFKQGDKVRILRRAKTNERGWRNGWASEMDRAIGKIGTVTFVNSQDLDVIVEVPAVKGVYGYPSFVLELVDDGKVPAPAQTTTIVTKKVKPFQIGQKVQVKYHPSWDGEGVIDQISEEGIYIVKFNRSGFRDRGGFEAKHLTVISDKAVPPAIQPVTRQVEALHIARGLAVQFAKTSVVRHVTIDTVQSELEKLGFKSTELGNAAGTIFKGTSFRNTGITVKSTRPGNRNRRVTVWEYVGQESTTTAAQVPGTDSGQFIVQVESSGDWRRSYNYTADRKSLNSHVFTTLEEAQKEAARQQIKSGGYRYRAIPLVA